MGIRLSCSGQNAECPDPRFGTVLILMNLERTFRSAVGTMRWRIKFIVLGLGIVFGARIYTLKPGAALFSEQPGSNRC